MRKMTLKDFINSDNIINKETDNLPDENNKFNPDINAEIFNKLIFGNGLIIDENNFIIYSDELQSDFSEKIIIDLFVFSNKENAISLIKQLEKCLTYNIKKRYESRKYNWSHINIEYLFNNSKFIDKMLIFESMGYKKVKYNFCDSEYDVSKFRMRKTIENSSNIINIKPDKQMTSSIDVISFFRKIINRVCKSNAKNKS